LKRTYDETLSNFALNLNLRRYIQVYKQQQSNVVIDGVKERRYFDGVQGDKDNQVGPARHWGGYVLKGGMTFKYKPTFENVFFDISIRDVFR